MSQQQPRILVTGAGGQLGRLVVAALLKRVPASSVVALVRNAAATADLAALGVETRRGNYEDSSSLDAAFTGIERLLLISSNAIGRRLPQHRNAIEAARRAGIDLIAYTSVLHANTSPLALAEEHRQTEAALAASGVPHALLRNGWYTENYTALIPAALAHGAHLGSAGDGLISSAARADYAEAAAVVLTSLDGGAGQIYEFAGDEAYTLSAYAADVARQSGLPVTYRDLPQAEFRAALLGAGLPEMLAELIADSDAAAARGALFDDGRQLSALIGRPTTPLRATIGEALGTAARDAA
jgi:NAD(P)H dehydrogenase (quinone)